MILPLALIICLITGCQDKAAMAELEEFKNQAALEEANKELAERCIDAWTKALASPNNYTRKFPS